MVSALFRTKHGSCALCGIAEPPSGLFTLNLTAGEDPKLEPKGERTHTGCCLRCWRLVGFRVLEDAVIYAVPLTAIP